MFPGGPVLSPQPRTREAWEQLQQLPGHGDRTRPAQDVPQGQVQTWCRKPGSDTVPEWLGRAMAAPSWRSASYGSTGAGAQVGFWPMAGLRRGPRGGWAGTRRALISAHGPESVEVTPCALGAVTEQLPDTRLKPCLKVLKHREDKTVCKSLAGNEEAFGFGFFAFGRQRAYSA